MDDIAIVLSTAGFERVPTVREVGEFAVRGGILDLYAPGAAEPVRLDFFGDTLESIRAFDPATQRTTGQQTEFVLQPASEISLTSENVARFRQGYLTTFGAPTRDDALYASITSQQRFAGMEHWLPLFHEKLTSVFECLPDAPVVLENLVAEALTERRTMVDDHYQSRLHQSDGTLGGDGVPYKPLTPDLLYLTPEDVIAKATTRLTVDLSPFDVPETATTRCLRSRHRSCAKFRHGAGGKRDECLRDGRQTHRRPPHRREKGFPCRVERRIARHG